MRSGLISISSAGSSKSSGGSAVNPYVWDETAEDRTEGFAEKLRDELKLGNSRAIKRLAGFPRLG
jgi:hypothetical protein